MPTGKWQSSNMMGCVMLSTLWMAHFVITPSQYPRCNRTRTRGNSSAEINNVLQQTPLVAVVPSPVVAGRAHNMGPVHMDIDQTVSKKPVPQCYQCREVRHMAHNCTTQGPTNPQFRALITEMMEEHLRKEDFPEESE
jgi:hypothetical protein